MAQKAGYRENRPFYMTPDFSGYMRNGNYKLSRGYIESLNTQKVNYTTAENSGFINNRSKYRLRFLFNPVTINLSYKLAGNLTFPPFESPQANAAAGSLFFPGLRTLGFELMFDRTYEVNADPGRNGGVEHDISVLSGLMGMGGRFTQNLDGKALSFNNQIPLPLPLRFVFGSGPGHLEFVGFMTTVNISYTHFSNQMTPMRCGVEISADELIRQNAGNAGVVVSE